MNKVFPASSFCVVVSVRANDREEDRDKRFNRRRKIKNHAHSEVENIRDDIGIEAGGKLKNRGSEEKYYCNQLINL